MFDVVGLGDPVIVGVEVYTKRFAYGIYIIPALEDVLRSLYSSGMSCNSQPTEEACDHTNGQHDTD